MPPFKEQKKWPYVLLALLFGVWVLHGWVLGQIGKSIAEAMREESGYPAHIRKMGGVLPFGIFHAKGVDFKTRFGPLDSIDWTIPDLRLDLKLFPILSDRYLVQSIDARSIQWVLKSEAMGGKIEGDLTVLGESSSLPPDLPPNTVWLERVSFSTQAPTGLVRSRGIELPHRTILEVAPFTVRNGEPVAPFEFDFQVQLTPDPLGPKIEARGTQDQGESRFEARVGAYALDPETIDRFLLTAMAFDPEMKAFRKEAGEWIKEGSFTLLLDFEATPTKVKGAVTLRLESPRFGDKVKDEEFASNQSLRPILESFEAREDTVVLGPLPFVEDLTTPQEEAWNQLKIGLAAAVFGEAPDAAIQTGVGLLRDLFEKD